MLSHTSLAAIAHEVAKYPEDRKQAAITATLRVAQNEKGWISNGVIAYIAELLDLQPIQVFEVASRPEDLDLLESMANNIEGRTICALGDTAGWPVQSFLKNFRQELEAMIDSSNPPRRCAA